MGNFSLNQSGYRGYPTESASRRAELRFPCAPRDEGDALHFANGTCYILAAGAWNGDIERVRRFAK
jgi:hypothetical protein